MTAITAKLRLLATNPRTGATREVISESHEGLYGTWRPPVLIRDGQQFVWLSFADQWRRLYLYDISGKLVRTLTTGDYSVDRVVTVDEKRGWVYYIARADRMRPYDTHLCRVDLDGRNFTQLTEEEGQHDHEIFGDVMHRIQFSPSKEFFLDSHSTPSREPMVDLRRADGTLFMKRVVARECRRLARPQVEAARRNRRQGG